MDELGFEKDSEELLNAIYKIGGESLSGDFPEKGLMASLSALLNDQNIPFAIIGGIAVHVHGVSRSTENINALVESLSETTNTEYMRKFGFYKAKSSTGTVLSIAHRTSGYVELLLANDSLRKYAIATAQPHQVLMYNVPVVQPDALIALKIKAMVNNPARENKDATDIFSIWKKNKPNLDTVKKFLSAEEKNKLKELIGG